MAVVSLAKLSGEVSRTSIVISYLLALIIMPLVRYGGKVLLFNIGIWEEPVLILGFNHTGCLVAEALQNDQYLGYRLAGFLTMNGESDYKPQKDYNIAGSYEQAKTIITSQGIRHIIIAAPHLPGSELVELSNGLQPYTRSIIIVPDLVGLPMVDGDDRTSVV
jgi:undecaprenyl-phosphate galactose phosphotransferase